jgi:hypothetical protein
MVKTFSGTDLDFLSQWLDLMLEATKAEFPYVIDMAAEKTDGKVIFSDSL